MTAEHATLLLMQNGLALGEARNLTEAIQCFRKVLDIEPQHAHAAYLLGACLRDQGEKEEALGWITQAASWQPEIPDVYLNLATLLVELKRPAEAEIAFRRAIDLAPTGRGARIQLAVMLAERKRWQDARELIAAAVTLPFASIAEAIELAATAINLEMPDLAEPCLAFVLKEEPDHAEALLCLATGLHGSHRHGEAEEVARRLVALHGPTPENLRALAEPLIGSGRTDEAISLLESAMADFLPDILAGRGGPGKEWLAPIQSLAYAKLAMDDLDGAIALYRFAEKLAPDDHGSRFNLSLCLLKNGNLLEGWERYESRWLTRQLEKPPELSTKPLWLGKVDPAGKTILIHWEQGLGDTIQFLRYALLVVAIGGKVILVVQDPLFALLSPLGLPMQILRATSSLPAHDFYCPLLSLPLAFETTLETIPSVPAYLAAEPARVWAWRGRLGLPRGLRVGLAWSGNPRFLADQRRSISLEALAPLLDLPQIEFFCLQKEIQPADLPLARSLDMRVFASSLNGFEETAALIENMDLVISVDTSIAHLAGAMGKPVWILHGYPSDWRWLLKRRDTPWYPSARLYRRTRENTWGDVIAEVASDLLDVAQAHRAQLAKTAGAAGHAR